MNRIRLTLAKPAAVASRAPHRSPFELGSPVIEKRRIGREGHEILIVDHMLRQASEVVDFAIREVKYIPGPKGSYFPGIRGRGSQDYVRIFREALEPVIRSTYSLSPASTLKISDMFSVTNIRPERLSLQQQMPHVDEVGMRGFGVVHYLFDKPLGGTAFFRHKATGWESLDEERMPRYERIVAIEAQAGLGPGYRVDRGDFFELVEEIEPAMDRMVIFPAHLLHGAVVPQGAPLSDDPRDGRLTMNCFITLQ